MTIQVKSRRPKFIINEAQGSFLKGCNQDGTDARHEPFNGWASHLDALVFRKSPFLRETDMRKSRFTEDQIVKVLKERARLSAADERARVRQSNVARQIIEKVEDRLQHQPAAFEPEWARTN
jgi:hypothetical protein